MAQLDLSKLSRLDWVVAGASVLAFISLFLPWYGASFGAFSASVSGWSTSYGWLGGLLIVIAGVLLLLDRSGQRIQVQKMGPALLVLGVAAIGTLLVIIRWITLPSGSGSGSAVSYSYGPRVGIYLALVLGIVQCVAALRLFRASGETLPNVPSRPTVSPAEPSIPDSPNEPPSEHF